MSFAAESELTAWRDARAQLLEAEKEVTRATDVLAEQRRALPKVKLTRDYALVGANGPVALSELFGDASQLLVWHFMFGPDWDEGCPSCSFWADSLDGNIEHLAARDVAFASISEAPVEQLHAYRDRMGWSFDWYSCGGTSFGYDMGRSHHPGVDPEAVPSDPPPPESVSPGLSVFERLGDEVSLTYQTTARGLEPFNAVYGLLDLTPKGRDEDSLPWTMAWVRRHDRYE